VLILNFIIIISPSQTKVDVQRQTKERVIRNAGRLVESIVESKVIIFFLVIWAAQKAARSLVCLPSPKPNATRIAFATSHVILEVQRKVAKISFVSKASLGSASFHAKNDEHGSSQNGGCRYFLALSLFIYDIYFQTCTTIFYSLSNNRH